MKFDTERRASMRQANPHHKGHLALVRDTRKQICSTPVSQETKLGHQVPSKSRVQVLRVRPASTALNMKQKWTFYCRVVNIDAKNDQHSEGKFRKLTDAYSKTPTSRGSQTGRTEGGWVVIDLRGGPPSNNSPIAPRS